MSPEEKKLKFHKYIADKNKATVANIQGPAEPLEIHKYLTAEEIKIERAYHAKCQAEMTEEEWDEIYWKMFNAPHRH